MCFEICRTYRYSCIRCYLTLYNKVLDKRYYLIFNKPRYGENEPAS